MKSKKILYVLFICSLFFSCEKKDDTNNKLIDEQSGDSKIEINSESVPLNLGQPALSEYSGFWENSRRIDIFDLMEYYPERLPFLRNEIFARYGRPFANQIYRDHFNAQSWYQEKSDFSESWLSQIDNENAAFIASVEQSIRNNDEITAQVLSNIEYSGEGVVITFTSRNELMWSDNDVDFGPYGVSGGGYLTWAIMGDWIIAFDTYSDAVSAVKLDHGARKITSAEYSKNNKHLDAFRSLLRAQGKSLPK